MTHIFYFTADWCGPCKKVRPIVEELKRESADTTFLFIDADEEMELVRNFEVRSIPTFIKIQDGKEVARITGAQTKKDLEKFIK